MSTFLLVTAKSWHNDLFESLKLNIKGNWIRIQDKIFFTKENLDHIKPDFIFIPHWSNIIPEEIYNNFNCIVFHMTDLPYGRGGSPLQNLILRNHKETMISAIKVEKNIDAGDIYLKMPISLEGSAKSIFQKSALVIEKMIYCIINDQLVPYPQIGEPVFFKRRKPSDSNVNSIHNMELLYDYIRMLDCDGYPKAFLETESFKLEFSEAVLNNDNSIEANVRIIPK